MLNFLPSSVSTSAMAKKELVPMSGLKAKSRSASIKWGILNFFEPVFIFTTFKDYTLKVKSIWATFFDISQKRILALILLSVSWLIFKRLAIS